VPNANGMEPVSVSIVFERTSYAHSILASAYAGRPSPIWQSPAAGGPPALVQLCRQVYAQAHHPERDNQAAHQGPAVAPRVGPAPSYRHSRHHASIVCGSIQQIHNNSCSQQIQWNVDAPTDRLQVCRLLPSWASLLWRLVASSGDPSATAAF
jgi:hypothetical protein